MEVSIRDLLENGQEILFSMGATEYFGGRMETQLESPSSGVKLASKRKGRRERERKRRRPRRRGGGKTSQRKCDLGETPRLERRFAANKHFSSAIDVVKIVNRQGFKLNLPF